MLETGRGTLMLRCGHAPMISARRGTYPGIAAETREPLVVKLANSLPGKTQLAADLRE